MSENINVFASAWLRDLSVEQVRRLSEITEFVDLGSDDTVYAMSGPQEYLWGISSGQVRVHVALNEEEPMLGHIHRAGAWFGESELIQNVDGLVEMKAYGETKLAKIAYTRFRKLAKTTPDIWEAFARLASMNQLLAMSAANDLVLRKSKDRIAATLLRLSGRRGVIQGTQTSDIVEVNQQDLARLANIVRSKASVHLRALADEGYIEPQYAAIRLLDPVGLSNSIGR